MKAMAAAAKSIDAVFKGTSPYDAKAFKSAAETIRAFSGKRLSELFVGPVVADGSKASASIEAERPTFDKLATDLGAYAEALSVAADHNPDVLAPDMRMQGTCDDGRATRQKEHSDARPDVHAGRARFPYDAAGLHVLPRQVPDERQLIDGSRWASQNQAHPTWLQQDFLKEAW